MPAQKDPSNNAERLVGVTAFRLALAVFNSTHLALVRLSDHRRSRGHPELNWPGSLPAPFSSRLVPKHPILAGHIRPIAS
jgi:hypothetical protein